MQLILTIAVKPYVLKYLAHDHIIHPFVLNKTNKYGIFLLNCLSKPKLKAVPVEKKTSTGQDKKKSSVDLSSYTGELKVMVSEHYWEERGGYISPELKLDFNKMVLYDFHEEFYKYVRYRIGPKGSINKAILEFREQFDISEDELSFKTIQRAFQRHNEKLTRSLSA